MSAIEFRDHWVDTEAEWSHRGAWLLNAEPVPTSQGLNDFATMALGADGLVAGVSTG